MAGPLSHIRVLDLSRVLAGPWAGQTLADLGADVIKVERPGSGDDTRGWGPPYLTDADGRETTEAAYYLSANRGKRSITLNLASPRGQAITRDLAARCDILIENYKVGGLAKYGLAYDDLKDSHDHLIYCSITGFGHSGPYAARAGYDFMIQGIGGLMSVTGEPAPGGGPVKVGVAIADLFTGMYSVTAILAALTHRDRGGGGQHIDMALLDCQVAMLANQSMNYLTSGVSPERMGNAHPNIVPYQAFPTADSHIIIAIGTDAQFMRFCKAIERPDLAADPNYANNGGRVKNREALVAAIAETLAALPSTPLQETLDEAGIPWGPINSIEQVFADPQVVARGLRRDIDHPLGGTVPMVRNPIRYSKSEIDLDRPPPLLGQHTDAVLSELLSLGDDELTQLRAQGVIS